MIEKKFRSEDPPVRIILFILFVVSLLEGSSLAVKIGLQSFPPLKMAAFRCTLGLIVVGSRTLLWYVNANAL